MAESLVQLELSKDLWRPNRYDSEGNVIERPDTLIISQLPLANKSLSPDAQAILMAEFEALKAEVTEGK